MFLELGVLGNQVSILYPISIARRKLVVEIQVGDSCIKWVEPSFKLVCKKSLCLDHPQVGGEFPLCLRFVFLLILVHV